MSEANGNGGLHGVSPNGMSRRVGTEQDKLKGMWERANDAGIRLVKTEIQVAESLLGRTEAAVDPRHRMKCAKEARAAIECAARFARGVDFPDGEAQAITGRIQQLRNRVDEAAGTADRDSGGAERKAPGSERGRTVTRQSFG